MEVEIKEIKKSKKLEATEITDGIYYATRNGNDRILLVNRRFGDGVVAITLNGNMYESTMSGAKLTYSNIKKIKKLKIEYEV